MTVFKSAQKALKVRTVRSLAVLVLGKKYFFLARSKVMTSEDLLLAFFIDLKKINLLIYSPRTILVPNNVWILLIWGFVWVFSIEYIQWDICHRPILFYQLTNGDEPYFVKK